MEDWVDEAAAALGEARLDPDEVRLVLRLARDVAHGVERKVAPLASYLAGAAAGRASAGATGPDAAARRMEALGSIVATLGPSIPRVGDGPLSRSDPERGLDGPSDG